MILKYPTITRVSQELLLLLDFQGHSLVVKHRSQTRGHIYINVYLLT